VVPGIPVFAGPFPGRSSLVPAWYSRQRFTLRGYTRLWPVPSRRQGFAAERCWLKPHSSSTCETSLHGSSTPVRSRRPAGHGEAVDTLSGCLLSLGPISPFPPRWAGDLTFAGYSAVRHSITPGRERAGFRPLRDPSDTLYPGLTPLEPYTRYLLIAPRSEVFRVLSVVRARG